MHASTTALICASLVLGKQGQLAVSRGTLTGSSGCTISLAPSQPSPQLVGERIVWTATAANCGDSPVYQFSLAGSADDGESGDFEHHRRQGKQHPFKMVRDFSPDNTFVWAPVQEGVYDVMVIVKNGFDATDSTSAIVSDRVNSRVTGTEAVLTPTLNPLVALYSAPPCSEGTILVKFRVAKDPSDPPWTSTNRLPCMLSQSRNFLVAGMLANTTYEMEHVTSDGSSSPPLLFTTGTPPADFPRFTVRQAPGPESDLSQNLIYHNLLFAVTLLATDLSGRVVWYYDISQSGLLTVGVGSNLVPDGTVLLPGSDRYSDRGTLNVSREIDLAGNPLQETNIDAVNAQLTALGFDRIYGFHHVVQRLPNGTTVVLGVTERTVDINGTPTNYAGDMIVVLDQDFQVEWAWDAFDYLDVTRRPILGEACTIFIGPGCTVPNLPAVEWLHSNDVTWSPADGNLILSIRHQDWVIKIDYAAGSGDGHIIWRLGEGGDFTADSTDPYPWFSHQHNAHYSDDATLLVFDNGNTRCLGIQDCHSRGQVWALDEGTMTATSALNADLGNYSAFLGGAQGLPNGNFFFSGGPQTPDRDSQSIEMLPDGTTTYVLEVAAAEYRSVRISDLYRAVHP